MGRDQDISSFVLSAFFATVLLACSSPPVPADPVPAAPTKPAAIVVAAPSITPIPGPVVSPVQTEAPPAILARPAVSKSTAEAILNAKDLPSGACPETDEHATIRCWIEKRYEGEPAARTLALAMFDRSGHIAGVEAEHMMDGGFRGTIHIVPEWPLRQYKKHLDWVAASAEDFDAFFDKLATKSTQSVHYRHRAIAYKFLRSVNRRTPSAYASGWQVGYNVSGSLHGSVDAVRETLFHEIFHLNDAEHSIASMSWSAKTLGTIHDTIVGQCGTRIACLTPYAPMPTMVRGGTYYSFQPNNGLAVHEYAAELATRYYREHRAILRGEKLPGRAFKCGPKENAEAWKLLIGEFFAGIDLVPPC